MQIDGKNFNKLNQTSGTSRAAKTNGAAAANTTELSSVQLSKASQFALHHSGLDQQLRRTNDSITLLQTRKEALKEVQGKLESLKSDASKTEVKEQLSEVLRDGEVFANNKTYEHLKDLIQGNPVDSKKLENLIGEVASESNAIQGDINQQLKNFADPKQVSGEELLQQFTQKLRSDPSLLANAHGGISGSTTHGLLGSTS